MPPYVCKEVYNGGYASLCVRRGVQRWVCLPVCPEESVHNGGYASLCVWEEGEEVLTIGDLPGFSSGMPLLCTFSTPTNSETGEHSGNSTPAQEPREAPLSDIKVLNLSRTNRAGTTTLTLTPCPSPSQPWALGRVNLLFLINWE